MKIIVQSIKKVFTTIFMIVVTMSIFTAVPVPVSAFIISKTYTLDADFDEGTLIGVEHDTVHDQLQLSQEVTTLPFIWVPNATGSVSKINTETGKEIGRYLVAPFNGNPSRTTVDIQGACWVGNRQAGTVVKIGLYEAGQYIDRNGNGIIETSMDTNGDGDITGAEILPWGQDECVLYEVVLVPGFEGAYAPGTYAGPYDTDYWGVAPRGLAIDASNNLWAGTWNTSRYYCIDGSTGSILRILDTPGHNAYGAVIDKNGILWSTSLNSGQILRIDISEPPIMSSLYVPHYGYGIGLDRLDHLFSTGWENYAISRININTSTLEMTKSGGEMYGSRGIAFTEDNNAWVANSHANTVTRYDNDLNLLAIIPVGTHPTGVSVDAIGKVWVCDLYDESIHRIDPVTNTIDLSKQVIGSGGHYTYSDMTGIISRTITTKTGTWTTTFDSGTADTPWSKASWNSNEPDDTSVTVKVRSSNDGTTWSAWEDASNAVQLVSTPNGQYLQIETTLKITSGDVSPILYDLTVESLNIAKIVNIDIKPGSFPNSINLKNKGKVPVAILSSADFDATTVNPETVVFAGAPALSIGMSPEDVNGDGLLDRVLHFSTQSLLLTIADTQACLTGETYDGGKIEGCDSVRIVK